MGFKARTVQAAAFAAQIKRIGQTEPPITATDTLRGVRFSDRDDSYVVPQSKLAVTLRRFKRIKVGGDPWSPVADTLIEELEAADV
jgi:hypothetical protein